MNRNKYKVWDTTDNKYLPINSDNCRLTYQGDIWILTKPASTIEELVANFIICDGLKYIMCQNTGLIDDNGVDIYEHDLIKTRLHDGWRDTEGYETVGVIGWSYNDCGWRVFFTEERKYGCPIFSMTEKRPITVIGNCFTPHLLGPI